MQVKFPSWPIWNYQFPERDVMRIDRVAYWPKGGNAQEVIPAEQIRLAISRTGVSAMVFKDKRNLPELAARIDAVTVDYVV